MMGANRRVFLKSAIAAPLAAAVAVGMPIAAGVIAEPLPVVPAALPHPWEWWFSCDSGEFYSEQFDSMEAALRFLKSEGEGLISECRRQDFDMELDGDAIFELLMGQNEDVIGEGEFLDDVTNEQIDDLGVIVSAAIEEWVRRHKVDLAAWTFGGVRNTVKAKDLAAIEKGSV